jgi:hypothetical protein
MCLENGVQIKTGNTELGKIGKLFGYSLKVTAVIIVIKGAFSVVLTIFGLLAPIFGQISVLGNAAFEVARFIKSVGEYLINDSALYPIGSGKTLVIAGDLPPFTLA